MINTPQLPFLTHAPAGASPIPSQVTSPVLWENTIKTLLEKGMSCSYEVGPGKVIAGIVKRIDKAHVVTNIVA